MADIAASISAMRAMTLHCQGEQKATAAGASNCDDNDRPFCFFAIK